MRLVRVLFVLAVLLVAALPVSAECEYWACVRGEDYAACNIMLACNNPPCDGMISWTRSLFCQGMCDGRKGCWCRQSAYCYDI